MKRKLATTSTSSGTKSTFNSLLQVQAALCPDCNRSKQTGDKDHSETRKLPESRGKTGRNNDCGVCSLISFVYLVQLSWCGLMPFKCAAGLERPDQVL